MELKIRRRMYQRVVPGVGNCKGGTCADLFELESGDFLVIGTDVTKIAKHALPKDAGVGSGERAIILPRTLLIASRKNIPMK